MACSALLNEGSGKSRILISNVGGDKSFVDDLNETVKREWNKMSSAGGDTI
jgi:hypothetical protein